MAGLPRVFLALLSLLGLTTAIIPGLLLGGPFGQPGHQPLLGGLLSGNTRGLGLGGASPGSSSVLKIGSPPGGGGVGLPLGPAGNLLSSLLSGAPLPGGPAGLVFGGGGPGGRRAAAPGAHGASGTADDNEPRTEIPGGRAGSRTYGAGAGSSGSNRVAESSEEDTNRRPTSGRRGPATSQPEEKPTNSGDAGSSGSNREVGSSEEDTERRNTVNRRRSGKSNNGKGKPTKRLSGGGAGSRGSNRDEDSSEEDTRKAKKRPRGEDSHRKKRSLMDEFSLMGTKGAHPALDNVPDHVKVVYCGRHEVPNPGGIEDHFCHPDATWDTLLRMRPDCVCQQGFLRNSWGECISPAECDHCSDKHHLNMDYHLCESPCPIVCNQPIDENCPNTCFKECACRPGYIRAYPNGPCVSIKQCLPGCRGRNQIFSLCSSLCPPTCRKPVPKRCPNICAGEGCVCKPGYVVKKWEPLVCVRPEKCPGRSKKCPGPNQRYSRCIRRCAPSCFKRRHRYCGHECLGRGCVCKRGYVVLQRRPLLCVRRDECPARRKKCPARNQVYMYCKSKCPRTCEEPKPRKCGSACGGEGCACKPGYVIKQEDPLVCVRRYQCDFEDMGHKGAKGAMGAKGLMGVKGAMGGMGATGAKGSMEAKGAMGAMGTMGVKGAKGSQGSPAYPPFTWPSVPNEF